MKKIVLNKVSGLLAALMIVSMLVPVIAAAAVGFQNLSYSQAGTVTGQVYHSGSVTEGVYVDVLDENQQLITTTYATYGNFDGTNSFYNIGTDVTNSVYQAVYIRYAGVISPVVSRASSGPVNPGTGGVVVVGPVGNTGGTGTGGTGTGTGGTTAGTIDLGAAASITAEQLTSLLNGNEAVTITITGETLTIPVTALLTNEDAVVTISNGQTSISLPIEALDLANLADELNVAVGDLTITVTMNVLTGDELAEATEAAEAVGGEILGPVVDFTVMAMGPNNVSQEIESFGDFYVQKTIALTGDIDPQTATGVVLNEETGEFEFVPSVFSTNLVTIWSNHNSIYTVLGVENALFADVPATHWAAADIQLLSNKLIVRGVNDTQFQPTRDITRAEFAALVVRSLGLEVTEAGEQFSDVVGSAWYSEEVAAAAEAGLVAGYADGTFRPNQTITRAELAALVVRALNYAGTEVTLTSAEQDALLSEFKDAAQVGNWARDELAIAVQAGIVVGVGADMIAPQKTATRAEATAMLARYLREAGFINE